MPAMLVDQPDLPRTVRMTLLVDNFNADGRSGRMCKAGTVLMVDKATAERWRDLEIAVDSAETDKTIREQKAAQVAALQAELAAMEAELAPKSRQV
jgi:hypothetical protein